MSHRNWRWGACDGGKVDGLGDFMGLKKGLKKNRWIFNRLRRVPPATMEKGYPANQQPLHWPSKNMAFVKTLALAFNTLFVSKVFLWKRGS